MSMTHAPARPAMACTGTSRTQNTPGCPCGPCVRYFGRVSLHFPGDYRAPGDRPGAGSMVRRPRGVRSRFVMVVRLWDQPGGTARDVTITRTMMAAGDSYDDRGVMLAR